MIYNKNKEIIAIGDRVINNVKMISSGKDQRTVILHKDQKVRILYKEKEVVLNTDGVVFYHDFLKAKTSSIIYRNGNKYYHLNLDTEKQTEFFCLLKSSVYHDIWIGDRFIYLLSDKIYDIDKQTDIYLGSVNRVAISEDFLNGKTGFFYTITNNKKNNLYVVYFYDKKLLEFVRKDILLFPYISKSIYLKDKYITDGKNVYEINHNNGNLKFLCLLPEIEKNSIPYDFISENGIFQIHTFDNKNALKQVYLFNALVLTNKKTIIDDNINGLNLETAKLYFNILSLYRQNKKNYYLTIYDKKYLIFNSDAEHKIENVFDINNDIYIATNNNSKYLIQIKNGKINTLSDKFTNNTMFYNTGIENYVCVKSNNTLYLHNCMDKNTVILSSSIEKIIDINKISDSLILIKGENESEVFMIYNVKQQKTIVPFNDDKSILTAPMQFGFMDYFCVYDIKSETFTAYDKEGQIVCNIKNFPLPVFSKMKKSIVNVRKNNVFPSEWNDLKNTIEKQIAIKRIFKNIKRNSRLNKKIAF